MKNRTNQRLEEITVNTLIVGVDVAKSLQWARFVDYRGIELGKTISFRNDKNGFETIVAKINEICNIKCLKNPINKVIVGMEPTGHYWKTLANYLMQRSYKVVGVNPYHTKKSKELDDNSPTKCDKKDAITIARLVKDGRFFDPYLPQDVYAELRVLSNARISVMKRNNALKNTIIAVLDEYFPEITSVFKNPLKGKASRQVLRDCPFPKEILKLGEIGVLAVIKKAVRKTVGIKKVKQLIAVANDSIGVEYGQLSTKLKLVGMLDELELIEKQLETLEKSMEEMLETTGYAEQILSIKGIGIVTAATFIGEIGDPMRFSHARQISNLAGYNLAEDSSGKNKSGTAISKRGRKQLRNVLYQMAFTMVGQNAEMKELYNYLKTRKENPLKKKQALVVISKKIITVIYNLIRKQETYKPELVLGKVRKEMLIAA
jgi:transposase